MRSDWGTPHWLWDLLSTRYDFDLDAASDPARLLSGISTHYCVGSLERTWFGNVYCNPPYKDITPWIWKGIEGIFSGDCESVTFLLPARVETEWFAELMEGGADLIFIRGRLAYGDAAKASFPSLLVRIPGKSRIDLLRP